MEDCTCLIFAQQNRPFSSSRKSRDARAVERCPVRSSSKPLFPTTPLSRRRHGKTTPHFFHRRSPSERPSPTPPSLDLLNSLLAGKTAPRQKRWRSQLDR